MYVCISNQKMPLFTPFFRPTAGLFLESPGNFSGQESCFLFAPFTFKIKFSIILKSNKMKLSDNEAKLTGLSARNCATIQQVLILKFAFGPKSFVFFRETGPWPLRNYVIITEIRTPTKKSFF